MANPKTIYLNLEDDVSKIVARLDRERGDDVVLVFPKKSFIFSDSINLRLLKKQIDMLGKKVSILTMDTKGQMFAKEAGFNLKFLPKTIKSNGFSDIRVRQPIEQKAIISAEPPVDELPFQPELEPVPISKLPKKIVTPQKIAAPVAKSAVRHKASRQLKREPITNDFLETYPNRNLASASANAAAVAVAISASNVQVAPTEVPSQRNWYIPPSDKTLAPQKKKSHKRLLISFIAVALIVSILLVWVVLPSASVTVKAKTQSISRDLDVTISTQVTETDSANLTVPGRLITETKSYNETFQTLGKKEIGSKAQGRVGIYNLTGSPMTLRASTTVLTVGSKNYFFSEDQNNVRNINSASNDADAPTADIVADGGGELFNLPAGTRLEITNQAFGSQPQRLYAKTITQVIGGSSRFTSIITPDDTQAAREKFEEMALTEIDASLEAENMNLVEGGYQLNFDAFSMDKPEQTETPTFLASAQLSISGIAFNEQALKQLLRERVGQTLGSGKILQEEDKDTIAYKINSFDLATGRMQISLTYESESVPEMDLSSIKTQLAGKSRNEAKQILESNPDIEESRLIVFPTFLQYLPRMSNKIEIKVE